MCKGVNKYQMEYILDIQDEYKNELLILFNKCINTFTSVMLNNDAD